MKAMQVGKPGAKLQLAEVDTPEPRRGQVRIKVEACGLCHSDSVVKEGLFPGIVYPRIPGHEVAGTIDKAGEAVTAWKEGQRVGVGWHGGHDSTCESCRRGDFINCRNAQVTGISFDGGYAQYMVVPQEALALIPRGLASIEAAPLLCAGVTTYNSLRHCGASPGDIVAVHGIGGLGHLGLQFASKMGFRTVALSHGPEKEDAARRLGASEYIDMDVKNAAKELSALGGARAILATGPNVKEMSALVDGLAVDGTLLVVGVSFQPIEVSPIKLIAGRRRILGWPSGSARDSQDCMEFAALAGVRPLIETCPLERANEAYERMIANKARMRIVLEVA